MPKFIVTIKVRLEAESEEDATYLMENWLDSAEENLNYPNKGYCDYIVVEKEEE